MKYLYFIRTSAAAATETHYDEWTDVWVFGDVAGYAYFAQTLMAVAADSTGRKLTELDRVTNTMMVQILPPVASFDREPRLRLVERLVLIDSEPTMELIILGNILGLRKLAQIFEKSIESYTDQPEEHTHIDPDSSLLVQRSVSANVRGPLQTWAPDKLGNYSSLIYDPSARKLPENAKLLAWEWTAIEPESDPYLSLNDFDEWARRKGYA